MTEMPIENNQIEEVPSKDIHIKNGNLKIRLPMLAWAMLVTASAIVVVAGFLIGGVPW